MPVSRRAGLLLGWLLAAAGYGEHTSNAAALPAPTARESIPRVELSTPATVPAAAKHISAHQCSGRRAERRNSEGVHPNRDLNTRHK
jgi:hypothetical protein